MDPADIADLAIRKYREAAPSDACKIEFWGLLQCAIIQAIQEYDCQREYGCSAEESHECIEDKQERIAVGRPRG